MGVATVIIAMAIVVTTAVGPEKRGRKFELAGVAGTSEMGAMRKDSEAGRETECRSFTKA